MSPLSVVKVTSKVALGIDLEGGGAGHGDLRYRPCRSPSMPESGASSAICSRSWGPTRRPCAKAGRRSTWPRTSSCASATSAPRPGILLGGRFEATLDRLMAGAKATGYRHLVDRVRNGPPLGPMAIAGAAHAPQPQRVRGAPRGRPPRQRPRPAHGSGRPAGGRVEPPAPPGAADAPQGRRGRRAGAAHRRERPSWPVAGPRSCLMGEPVELLLYLFGRRGRGRGRPQRRRRRPGDLAEAVAGPLAWHGTSRPRRCRGRAGR